MWSHLSSVVRLQKSAASQLLFLERVHLYPASSSFLNNIMCSFLFGYVPSECGGMGLGYVPDLESSHGGTVG